MKCWPLAFLAIEAGIKLFEFRRNDRGYVAGDSLHLMMWDPTTEQYTGRELTVDVPYLLEGGAFGIPDGYVVMSVRLRATPSPERTASEPLTGPYDISGGVTVTMKDGVAVSFSADWQGCTWYRIADECLYQAQRLKPKVATLEAIARACLDRAAGDHVGAAGTTSPTTTPPTGGTGMKGEG